MIGFHNRQGKQNGGTQHSTMSPPWLELEFSASHMPCQNRDASVEKEVQPDVEYGYQAKSTAGTVFGFFGALGHVAFCVCWPKHGSGDSSNNPSTPQKPTKGPMWKGVVLAYIVVALCYFPVALIGYWMYGNAVSDNILIS